MSGPIAVIGAGIAGLSCAQRLMAAGLEVEVIEKSRGPGGRCTTRRGESWQADHGAQYFTARDAGFRAAVADWQRAGIIAPWPARIVSVEADGSCRPASAQEPRFVGTPRMSAIGRHLSAGLTVRYDTQVTSLRRDGEGWRLVTLPGGALAQRYSAVIVCIPAPQAAALLEDIAPPLAARAAACVMRGCHALIARYARAPGLPFDAAFINRGVLSWAACDSRKPGRPAGHTWVVHAPVEDEAALDTSAEAISEAMIEAFIQLGAPRPDAFTLHRWRFAQNASTCEVGEVWSDEAGLGLAGDWLHGGRVEGAWLSAQRLADTLLKTQRSNSTP